MYGKRTTRRSLKKKRSKATSFEGFSPAFKKAFSMHQHTRTITTAATYSASTATLTNN